MVSRLRRVVVSLREHGVRRTAAKILERVGGRLVRDLPAAPAPKVRIQMLVGYEDALVADWTTPALWATSPAVVRDRPIRTAWLMHPPGESSGGHQNIFRFIDYLEKAGDQATVYLYDANNRAVDPKVFEQLVGASGSYPDVQARFRRWDGTVGPDVDALFATGWETAYPALLDPSGARRFYFVQDYEPAFYPVGTEHVLAENTYRFGFHGITAGRWLETKLASEYGMRTSSFDFAADVDHYRYDRTGRREDVFFYARPVTTRRGFELGVMALEHLARARPDVTLHLAGWDVSDYDLPFRYVNHAAMPVTELNDLYNECAVALVLSLTNLSLLPLELLASGVVPVLNEGPNNSMVSDNPFLRYCAPNPHALAAELGAVLDAPDQAENARRASQSVRGLSWDTSGEQFVRLVREAMHG